MAFVPLSSGFFVNPALNSPKEQAASSSLPQEKSPEKKMGPGKEPEYREHKEHSHGSSSLTSRIGQFRKSSTRPSKGSEYNDEYNDKYSLRSLEEELHQVQKENVAIRRDVESLQRELGQEREKASRYQRAANSMQTHMDNKELFLPSQLSDVSILRSIEGLMDSIRTWSFKQGEETSTEPSDVDGKRLADYQRVAPWVNSSKDIDEIRKKKKMRRFFLRGYLALLVSDWVFRNAPAPGVGNGGGRDFWAHPQPRSWFLALEDHLYYHGTILSHREINDWRALTADLLSKIIEDRQAKDQGEDAKGSVITEDFIPTIMALMPVWIDQSANEDLFGILTEAVRISQSLRRQRACWFVRFPFPGYRQVGKEYETCPIVFEPSFMQAEYGRDDSSPPPTPGLNVEFVLTPSVWKRGDDKGANFEKNEMIKMHCAVVLKESPLDYGAQGMYAPGM